MEELCLFLDFFAPYRLTPQTTVLHTADIGGALEADLQDTFTTEINVLP